MRIRIFATIMMLVMAGVTYGDLSDGLVAHWEFEEGAGTTAYDSVGGHDGNMTNSPDWVMGYFGGALSFDGVGDYVEAVGYKGVTGTDSRTCSAWVKTVGSGSILLLGDTNVNGARWVFQINAVTGNLRVAVGGGNIIGSTFIADGTWHHVAASFENDGTPNAEDIKLYVDGVEDTTTSVSPCEITDGITNADVMIGLVENSYSFFDGLIDDVRIYSSALSSGEIGDLSAGMEPAVTPDAYWAFDEGSGTTAYDSSGGHDGMLSSGPSWVDGVIGGGVSFDGINDIIEATGYKGVTGTQSRTSAAWVKFTRPDYTGNEAIISWGDSFNNRSWWLMTLERDTMPGVEGALRTGVGAGRVTGVTDIRDGQWHHVAAAFENDGSPSSTDIKIYVDGVEESLSHSNYSTMNTVAIEDVVIGCSWYMGDTVSYAQGLMDDVRIYDRALSGGEVWELYYDAAKELESIEIVGIDEVIENSQAQYNAIAYYDDGSSEDVTSKTDWFVEPDIYAGINNAGLLTAGQLFDFQEEVVVIAEFSKGDVDAIAEYEVVITADCTPLGLVHRNISSVLEIKEDILGQLEIAIEREKTAQSILGQMQKDKQREGLRRRDVIKARMGIVKAIIDEDHAAKKIEDSAKKLNDSLDSLEGKSEPKGKKRPKSKGKPKGKAKK